MNVRLMYPERDFDLSAESPPFEDALVRDLGLTAVFDAMAADDRFLPAVAKKALLASLQDCDTIRYRQAVLRDALANEAVVRDAYALAGEAIEAERRDYLGSLARHPSSVLHRAIGLLRVLSDVLRRVRNLADERAGAFESAGFCKLFATLRRELDDAYLASLARLLEELTFEDGILVSQGLGEANKATDLVLRKPAPGTRRWSWRALAEKPPPQYSYRLHPRDESGARALSELRDQGINLVANALAQSVDHILSFFVALRTELAFYVGCANLRARIERIGLAICFPEPEEPQRLAHRADGIYDLALALHSGREVVDNRFDADGKHLTIVTGANQGGKSTFLRAVGLAQLMMQCGMFAPATSLRAAVCSRLFTHFKREEDTLMRSGKFDEELVRMNGIAAAIQPRSLVLFNDAFAATNEREGSEVAAQIVAALIERDVRVFFVTHLYEFANGVREGDGSDALFLRAERLRDGQRTFKVSPGEPLRRSYGEDLYREIFGSDV